MSRGTDRYRYRYIISFRYTYTNILTLVTKLIIKILNLKLVILLEYQNKNIFAKGYFPNWSEEDWVAKKVKKSVPWTHVISYLNGEKIVGTFGNSKQQIKDNLELKK